MNASIPIALGPRPLRRALGLFVALWTLAVIASLLWNVHLLHDAMFEAAVTDARSDFNKDVLYRKWATLHGGVYVPVTAFTPPNPYLTNVVERDLITPSGRRLTLMNPAYMTRQVHELETRDFGTHGHITSIKPLRPANAPDPWETAALRAFERGRTEAIVREVIHGEPHLRLMRPLFTETGCLKCHVEQGHHEGDIRGGISIAIPLAPYLALAQARIGHVAGGHAGLWVFGLLGISLGARQLRRRLAQQVQAQEKLRQSEEKFRTVADWTYDMETWRGPDGRYIYVSPSAERITGFRAEEFLADPDLRVKITHPEDRARLAEHHQKVAQASHEVCSLEFRILTRGGAQRWISHHCLAVYGADGRWLGQRSGNRDITARKTAEAERERVIAELQQALAEIKILEGFIPICGWCKKIRDDRGFWNQVENYIARQAGAKFSHGICPDCAKKYYPDAEEERKPC